MSAPTISIWINIYRISFVTNAIGKASRQNIRQQEKKLEDITARYEQDLEAVNKQRKEIMRNAKEEAQRILSEANAKIENTIREIKEAQAEKEQTKLARKALEEFKASVIAAEEEDDKIAQAKCKITGTQRT